MGLDPKAAPSLASATKDTLVAERDLALYCIQECKVQLATLQDVSIVEY